MKLTKLFTVLMLTALMGAAFMSPAAAKAKKAPAPAAVIAKDGVAKMTVVLQDGAGEVEKHAALELTDHLKKMCGGSFSTIEEKKAAKQPGIFIGNTKRGKAIVKDAELKKLGADGFIIRTAGKDIIIRGASPRATMYGVYSLLEDKLGVRWYAIDTTYIPQKKTITLAKQNYIQKPAFEYRESFFNDAFDGDWAARNRQNGQTFRLKPYHGGQVKYAGFVHTFMGLVPPDKYAAEHPEYYSLIDGKRVTNGQLCVTNPEVRKIIIDRVLEIAESTKGEPTIISVSQNDNFARCKCPKCLEAEEAEGTPAGPVLQLVNAVADAVADKYPNVLIDTLAYQYTENAPKNIKPRKNVIIRLCHMAPSCDLHPLGKCHWNANFVRNLKRWSKISDRLYVWHYVTNFSHYSMPFPNLNAIKKDIAFYRDHHVRGFFAQGSYQSTGGDMAELNAWLIAKLLWNPDANADALVADFVKGFYGPAAPAMTEYFNLLHDQVKSNKYHAHLYSPPSVGYMDAELLDKMDKALTLAAEQAKGDQLASEHVRKARIGYTYTLLAAPEIFCPKDKPHCEKNRNLFKVFNDFQAELEHFGISNLNEWQPTSETLKKLRLSSLGWKE